MRLAAVLFLFLLPVSAWAGTITDDFEDGDWAGWDTMVTGIWNANVADRVSVVNGVVRLNHINGPGETIQLSMIKDWKDYSFSADMRIFEPETGAQ